MHSLAPAVTSLDSHVHIFTLSTHSHLCARRPLMVLSALRWTFWRLTPKRSSTPLTLAWMPVDPSPQVYPYPREIAGIFVRYFSMKIINEFDNNWQMCLSARATAVPRTSAIRAGAGWTPFATVQAQPTTLVGLAHNAKLNCTLSTIMFEM